MKQNKNLDLLDAPIILGEPGGVASELLDTVEKFTIFVKIHWISFLKKIWKNLKVKKISELFISIKNE